jgi:hypothetical protein
MFEEHDRDVLRALAARVRQVADSPLMAERRNLWRRHNALDSPRPMILIFPEGSWGELLPWDTLTCHGDKARHWEYNLRTRLYGFEHFASDNVVDADWPVSRVIHSTGWGLDARHRPSTTERGSWAFDPVVKSKADLERMHFPDIRVDDEATAAELALATETFGDLLDVKTVGVTHLSFHLMNQWTSLRGLEQVFMDMALEPDFLHAAMRFLCDGHKHLIDQYVALGLLSANNDNTYHSTGGNGYIDTLTPGASGAVKLSEMWASAESQELDPVSPSMHLEFAMQYERELLAPFGLTGYGCCDGLHAKLADVCALPNMRRISMSPFCDVDKAAPQVTDQFIFSWKPQPSQLVGRFDERRIGDYLQHTLDVCRGGVLEIILKDTHTCERQPERFDRWARLCRERVEAAAPQWR